MRIRRFTLLLAALLLLFGLASAEELPNPAVFLETTGTLIQTDYLFAKDYICDAYLYPQAFGDTFPVEDYLLEAERAGFVMERCVVEGYDAFRLADGTTGLYALLLPRYAGNTLLLLQQGMTLKTLPVPTATPAPTTPAATRVPTVTSRPSNGGHWEWQTQETDCPSCVGGVCSICHGTGTYRMYGEAVPCSRLCSSCYGRGTFTQRVYVYVFP